MTDNKLFEQWFWNDNLDDYNKPEYEMGLRAWNARAELANKKIAELQAQINELRKTLEETNTFLDSNIELAQSDEYGNMEPANSYSYELYRYVCFINAALAKTAPQCLQEHDNEVIEACAKVCDEYWTNIDCKAAIRTLKGKQNETA